VNIYYYGAEVFNYLIRKLNVTLKLQLDVLTTAGDGTWILGTALGLT